VTRSSWFFSAFRDLQRDENFKFPKSAFAGSGLLIQKLRFAISDSTLGRRGVMLKKILSCYMNNDFPNVSEV
jgi:hypothetical protein